MYQKWMFDTKHKSELYPATVHTIRLSDYLIEKLILPTPLVSVRSDPL